MAKNVFTRIGRPPKVNLPPRVKLPSGERQGRAPTDGLDTALPARAFPRNGRMAGWHDDPAFCRGGSTSGKKDSLTSLDLVGFILSQPATPRGYHHGQGHSPAGSDFAQEEPCHGHVPAGGDFQGDDPVHDAGQEALVRGACISAA